MSSREGRTDSTVRRRLAVQGSFGLDSKTVVDRAPQLLASKLLCRLDRDMAQEELDLIQLRHPPDDRIARLVRD